MKLFIFIVALLSVTLGWAQSAPQDPWVQQQKAKVREWVSTLPQVSVLKGDVGCESISFKQNNLGFTSMFIGPKFQKDAIGISRRTIISNSVFSEDFQGGGIDTKKFRLKLDLVKQGNQLISVDYKEFLVEGTIFTSEKLVLKMHCSL